MRPNVTVMVCCLLTSSVLAQGTLFTEDFESGTLGPDWLWTGSTPVMVSPGYMSDWCVSKESADLSMPPFADPVNQLSVLFHPLTYDPLLTYSVSAWMRVDDPMSTGASGWIYIGWIDGLDPRVDGLCAGAGFNPPSWLPNFSGTWNDCPNMLGPNAHFGVVFCMHAGSQNCHVYADNISVTSELATHLAEMPTPATMRVVALPDGGHVLVSFDQGTLPDVLTVHDAQGRLLHTSAVNGSRSLQLDISDLPNGVLVIRSSGAAGSQALRFVKT